MITTVKKVRFLKNLLALVAAIGLAPTAWAEELAASNVIIKNTDKGLTGTEKANWQFSTITIPAEGELKAGDIVKVTSISLGYNTETAKGSPSAAIKIAGVLSSSSLFDSTTWETTTSAGKATYTFDNLYLKVGTSATMVGRNAEDTENADFRMALYKCDEAKSYRAITSGSFSDSNNYAVPYEIAVSSIANRESTDVYATGSAMNAFQFASKIDVPSLVEGDVIWVKNGYFADGQRWGIPLNVEACQGHKIVFDYSTATVEKAMTFNTDVQANQQIEINAHTILYVRGDKAINAGAEISGEGTLALNNQTLTIDGAVEISAHVTFAGTAVIKLAEGATLTVPELTAGKVTTDVEGKMVVYSTDKYMLAPIVAKIGETPFASIESALAALAAEQNPTDITLVGTSVTALPAGYEDYKIVNGEIVAKTYVAQVGETKFETLQAAVDAAANGAVITLLEGFSTDEAIEVRGKAVEIRTADYKTAATPTVGLRVNYMDKAKITAQTIIYFRKPVTNTSTPTEIDRLIVGDFEAGIDVLTAVNEAEAVRYNIGIHDDITLTKDIVIPDDYGHYLTAGMNVKVSCTFDLNGHSLTQTSGAKGGWSNIMLFDATCDWAIPEVESLTFTLKDSKKTGAIYVPLHAVNATGETVVNIEDVKIVYGHNCTAGDVTQDNKSGGQAIVAITTNAGGTVNLTGSSSLVRDENCILTGAYPWALLPYEGSTIKVESGYYEGLMYGNGNGFGAINITGGTYTSDYIFYFVADDYVPANNGDDTWAVVREDAIVATDSWMVGEDEYMEYFTDLQAAIDYAEAGDEVTLLADVKLQTNPGVNVSAAKSFTLDLAGHLLAGYASQTKASYVILNSGDLTIVDSSEEKTGKIMSYATAADGSKTPGYASTAITNYGHLTLDGVYVESTGDGYASYAVDNDAENAEGRKPLAWATTKDVVLRAINGTTLMSKAPCMAVRQYLDTEEVWRNDVTFDRADVGSMAVMDGYSNATGKGFNTPGSLTVRDSVFRSSLDLGYWCVAQRFDICLENSTFTYFLDKFGTYSSTYLGDVTIKNCSFSKGFQMVRPVKTLTDGKYGVNPFTHPSTGVVYNLNDYLADGYEVVANTGSDAATYPWTIRAKPALDLSVISDNTVADAEPDLVIRVLEEDLTKVLNVPADVVTKLQSGTTEEKTEAVKKVQDILHVTQTNKLTAWQNYVMGVDGTKSVNTLDPQAGEVTTADIVDMYYSTPEAEAGTIEPVIIETPITTFNKPLDTGVTVTYNLLKGTRKDGVIVWETTPVKTLETPRFAVDFQQTTGDTFWKIEAVFTGSAVK